jgi:hypothetical protein
MSGPVRPRVDSNAKWFWCACSCAGAHNDGAASSERGALHGSFHEAGNDVPGDGIHGHGLALRCMILPLNPVPSVSGSFFIYVLLSSQVLHNELITDIPLLKKYKLAGQAARGMHFLHSAGTRHFPNPSQRIMHLKNTTTGLDRNRASRPQVAQLTHRQAVERQGAHASSRAAWSARTVILPPPSLLRTGR